MATDERYNDSFLLHATFLAKSGDEILQMIYGTEASVLQQPNSIGHCISADAWMSKGFAVFLSHRISGIRSTSERQNISWEKFTPLGIQQENAISTIWWLKKGFAINPTYRQCLNY